MTISPLSMTISLLSLAGEEVAKIEIKPEHTLWDLQQKVVAATGHSHFFLARGEEPLAFTGTVGEAGLLDGTTLNISVRDVGVVLIAGIPEDATFGGHNRATGCSKPLAELNGEWKPVPLLEFNGHPVWQRQTSLRNTPPSIYEGIDDGMRYLTVENVGSDGSIMVMNIGWLKTMGPMEAGCVLGSWETRERYGYIKLMEGESMSDAGVYLALKPSASFPQVVPHSQVLGANTLAGRAHLIKGQR